jgi:hypothetical protein
MLTHTGDPGRKRFGLIKKVAPFCPVTCACFTLTAADFTITWDSVPIILAFSISSVPSFTPSIALKSNSRRSSMMMGAALGLDDEALDELFITAAAL